MQLLGLTFIPYAHTEIGFCMLHATRNRKLYETFGGILYDIGKLVYT